MASLAFSSPPLLGASTPHPLRGALGRRLLPGHPFWAGYRLERLSESGAGASYEATIVLRRETERLRFRLAPAPAEAPLTRTALGNLVLLEDGRPHDLVSRPEHQVDRALAFLLSRSVPPKEP